MYQNGNISSVDFSISEINEKDGYCLDDRAELFLVSG